MPAQTIAPLHVGSIIAGRYRLSRMIGRGGMGDVYEAIADDGRPVAVKMVRRSLASDPQALARFAVEIRALARIRHRGVVALLDSGTERGVPFIVMEYVDGSNLDNMLLYSPGRRFTVRRTLYIMDAVCHAVQAMHDSGVSHNDLKTGNVFVEVGGRVVVGDLGMARPIASCCRVARGQIEGTPAYLAPERAAGLGGAPGPAPDIYALGVLAFRLLTGRLPFEGPREAVLSAQISRPPPRPSDMADVPRWIDAPVLRALAKDPTQRPQRAIDLIGAIARCLPVRTLRRHVVDHVLGPRH